MVLFRHSVWVVVTGPSLVLAKKSTPDRPWKLALEK